MEFDVVRTAETKSTNADLAEAARGGVPEGTVHVTDHQTAGRGRLDRTWEAPAGSGVAMSVLLRPANLTPARWSWIPLLAGVAVVEAVSELGASAALKWPNDVETYGRKLAGILVERVETPTGPAAVVGIGLNVAMSADQLPVPTATSLALEGVYATRDEVASLILSHVANQYSEWSAAGGEAALRESYRQRCSTIGSHVTVELPDGSTLEGLAADIDADGRLVVDGKPVSAGDVVSVRR